MNELFSPLHRRVDLAIAPPFPLGALRVTPSALEVEGPEGVQNLEPRVMQVLVALHRARGEPVSRDELSDQCWEGRIVGEDALIRCIGRLRKALAAEPRAVIDTIPKVGYRLRVAPAEAAVAPSRTAPPPELRQAEEAPTAAEPPRRKLRLGLLAAAGLAALIAVGGGALVWNRLQPTGAWTAEGLRPITTEPGIEADPALSPDGRFLVYAAGPSVTGPTDLFLKAVSEGAPLQLTSDPDTDGAPAWAPSGDRIAFVRAAAGEPCRLIVMPVPRGPERTVGRCGLSPTTRVAWLDERTLLLSDRVERGQVHRIRALDVETGVARDVSSPTGDSLGDTDPLASPDGRQLVFRRVISHGVDDLILADARTGAERRLTGGWKALGYAWAPDGRTLFLTTNRGGDFGLWTLDTRGRGEPKRMSLGLRNGLNFGSMSADGEGRLAVETTSQRKNLFSVGAGAGAGSGSGAAAVTGLTASIGRDWDPDVAPDGGLVFISDQDGAPDVWVRPAGGEPARMTQLAASYVHTPRWSPDGRRVVFVAAREQRTELWLMNADGSGLSRVTSDRTEKVSPAWDQSGRNLIYAERRGVRWRLMRVAAAGGEAAPLPGGEGFRMVRSGPDGALYGVKAEDGRLWRLPADGGAPTSLMPEVRIREGAWTLGPEGLYTVRDSLSPKPELWLRAWSGAERKVADLPTVAPAATVAVDPRTGAFIFPRKLRQEADIALLDVSPGA